MIGYRFGLPTTLDVLTHAEKHPIPMENDEGGFIAGRWMEHAGFQPVVIRLRVTKQGEILASNDDCGSLWYRPEALARYMPLDRDGVPCSWPNQLQYTEGTMQGVSWLGAVRTWIQCRFVNGETVTWGSHTPLNGPSLTPALVEEIGRIAVAADRNAIRDWMSN